MSVPVALLGLGAMGRAMQARLGEAGADVRAWRRGQASPTLAEVVAHADVIVVMVSDDAALLAVVDLAIPHARPGTLFVDMGTSGVAAALSADERLLAAGHRFI